MNTTLVIYHRADLDGVASYQIAKKKLGTASDYLGYDHSDPLPDLTPYTRVYLLDISLPPEVMSANAEKIQWCDHHKSSMLDCPSYIAGVRIEGVSACRISYQWFFGDRKAIKQDYLDHKVTEPYAIQLLGEYDVWLKTNSDTDPFQLGMESLQEPNWELALTTPDVPEFGARATEWIKDTVAKGTVIGSYLKVTNAKTAKERGFDVTFEGHLFHALNTSTKGSMIHDAAIRPEHEGCISYSWRGDGWGVSLYGVKGKDIDMSKIAKKHGGGGHFGASGMSLKTLPKEWGGV